MENEKTTQQAAAAKTILEKGVRVRVSAPLFLRLFWIKHLAFTIRASRYGTVIHTAGKMLLIEADWEKLAKGDLDEAYRLLLYYGKLVSEIVSFCILDRWWTMPLIKPFAWYLRTHAELKDITNAFMMVYLLNNPTPFTNAISLTRTTAETTMSPRNLSQENQGS